MSGSLQILGRLCLDKLGSTRESLTMAILRGMNARGLSPDMTAEPLCGGSVSSNVVVFLDN